MSATAISATTSAERSLAWPLPEVPVRPPSLSDSFTFVLIAANAGANPQSKPVSSASPRAKSMTGQFKPISWTRGSVCGSRLTPTRKATAANASPIAPPAILKTVLSTMACRSNVAARAPRASRTAISLRLRMARTSKTPARFAQAISRTTITAKSRVRSRGRACRTVSSCSGVTTA